MPKILVTLINDDGSQNQQSFELAGDLDCLDGIDEAVESFKNDALPKVEQQLLQQAQERAVAQEKKTLHSDTKRL